MADSSTASAPILDLIAGDCWARRQLRGGIKDVSVASKPRKSVTLVRVVFIDTLYYPSGNSLHNYARGICHHRGEHISEPKLPE